MAAPTRLGLETILVMGLSLGRSGVYALISLMESYSRGPLAQQTTTLNPSLSSQPVFDLVYQLLGIFFGLFPVALGLYLIGIDTPRVGRHLGCDGSRIGHDVTWGLGLAAFIGIPGMGLYLLAHSFGVNLTVATSGLTPAWWVGLVLVLAAIKNAVLEEVLVVGYLAERLNRLSWGPVGIILISSFIRASYHLYQGWGGFLGNLVMGVIFMSFYLKWRRLWPLIIAHGLIDIVAFIGYSYLPPHWLNALGIG